MKIPIILLDNQLTKIRGGVEYYRPWRASNTVDLETGNAPYKQDSVQVKRPDDHPGLYPSVEVA